MSVQIDAKNIIQLLLSKLQSMRVHERLYNSVDRERRWDGKLDASKIRQFDKSIGYTRHECSIPLTYGSLYFTVTTKDADDKVTYVRISYRIGTISGYYGKLLIKDRIDREWGSNYNDAPMPGLVSLLSSQKSFDSNIEKKVNNLILAVESWANNHYHIDNEAFKKKVNISAIASNNSFYMEQLTSSINRTRLISQLQAERIDAVGEDSSEYREINKLAHEMLDRINSLLKTPRMSLVDNRESW